MVQKYLFKTEKEKFESTHNVIVGGEYPMIEYYQARESFFLDCISEGQEVAIEKTLKKGIEIN